MHRDPSLVARNAFVIPGALLVFWCAAAAGYVQFGEPHHVDCQAAKTLPVPGMDECPRVLPILGVVALIGIVLIIVGLVRFRNRPAELAGHLYPGTGTHTSLAILASLFAVPFLAGLIQWLRASSADDPATFPLGSPEYFQYYVLFVAALVGLVIFLPFLLLFIRQAFLRRTFLAEALAEEPAAPAVEEAGEPEAEEPPAWQDVPPPEEGIWRPEEAEAWTQPEAPPEPAEAPQETGQEPPAWPPKETDSWEPETAWPPAEEGWPPAASPWDEGDAPEEPEEAEEPEDEPFPELPEEPDEPAEPDAPEAPWEPILPGESVAEPRLPDDDQADMEARVDAILREHPEVDSVHYTGVGRCIAQTASGSCGAEIEPGRHYCEEHECAHESDRGVRCHKPRIGDTKYCLVHGCAATTKSGGACKNPAVDDSNYCRVHQDEA